MSVVGEPLRRIEFHAARRIYTGVPLYSGDFCLEILNPGSSFEQRAASGSGIGPSATETTVEGNRSTGSEFQHGLDPELSFRISFQRIGAGLENLGNTCYLNSVLQCLTYTEPFAAYLQSGKHNSTCRAAGFCAMCALQNHVMDALQSTGKILRPFHLVRNLRCISRNFRNSRQEDAHEYMVNLLESMHKCCLPSGVQSESPSAYEKSPVHKIFGGQLRSQVRCMQCSYCSDKFDPFLDLSLEIARADSLRKAFAHFTATEQLDGGERQYQCQRCKEKVQAFKQLTIHKAPYVLTIHLKRFGSSLRGEKINKKVEFEPTLDVKPFVSGVHEGELKYTLYGVLVHAGWSTHSGHYFCYVRTSAGLWYSLDDNHVSQVSEKTVLSREAYMLFYVRDRTSAIKQSVQANLNANIPASSTGNKEAPLLERKLNTAVHCSGKPRHDNIIHDVPVSVMDNLRQNPFKNQEPVVQYNGDTTNKGFCLQVNDDVSSNGLCKTVLPTKKTESPVLVKLQLPFDTKANYPDIKKCSISLQGQKGRESFLNLLESKPAESLDLNKAVSSLQEEISTIPEIDNLLDVRMSKKRKLPLVAECSYFGRKQLFFLSLKLRKTKKKKTKIKHQNSRNEIRSIVDMSTDSQGASTSEAFRTVAVNSMHSFERDSNSTSGKKSKRDKGAKASFGGAGGLCCRRGMCDGGTCGSLEHRGEAPVRRAGEGNCVSPASVPLSRSSFAVSTPEFAHGRDKREPKQTDPKSGNHYSQTNDKEIHGSCITGDRLGPSKQPSRSSECTEERENVNFKNAKDEDIIQNCSVSLLKASLREPTVARWDADDSLTPQMYELPNPPKRNIGYLLDEWDEEYDRGKRKKLKSNRWFEGSNPFQKTADLRTQQRMTKVVKTSFGKEPLRI